MENILNILIIDDNDHKSLDISKSIYQACIDLNYNVDIIFKKSINSALYHMYYEDHRPYDFIFLDKVLPQLIDDDHLNPEGGLRILEELDRRDDHTPVILCSSDDWDYDISNNIIGSIKYDLTVDMTTVIESLISNQRR